MTAECGRGDRGMSSAEAEGSGGEERRRGRHIGGGLWGFLVCGVFVSECGREGVDIGRGGVVVVRCEMLGTRA